jgi:hypothetical protein
MNTHRSVPEQTFRRKHEERQRVAAEERRLPPQQMKVLRGRAVDEAQIDRCSCLEKPLGPGTRVLGPLRLVAVGEQEQGAKKSWSSADDFRRLAGERSGQAVVDAIRMSPHRSTSIEPPRVGMPVRAVDL